MTRALLVCALVLSAIAAIAATAPRAQACAFSAVPTAYEAREDRSTYILGLELAAYNMIRPSDTFFGTARIETGNRGEREIAETPYIPPVLLKATAWVESGMAQAGSSVGWLEVGPALISFDCGHGIMQITSGMTSGADGGRPSTNQALVATHFLFNIARGAVILADKWNAAPEARPIAGTDNDSDPYVVENWYFALWGYNGFTGPGANRSNHPMDPVYAYPRTGFSCGPTNDGYGHRYGDYPYQEIVLGCASRPPSLNGEPLWAAPSVQYALPDLGIDDWAGPLSLSNFASPYERMDIPSPRPWHYDPAPQPPPFATSLLLGAPVLSLSETSVEGPVNEITISNTGNSILSWRAKPQQGWVHVNKQGGVALGPLVPCADDPPCARTATLRITLDAATRATDPLSGWVDIESLTTGAVQQVFVRRAAAPTPTVAPDQATATRTSTATPTATPTPTPVALTGDVNCQGTVDAVDAAFVLQYSAGFVTVIPCQQNADVSGDGRIDPIDAALILQYTAGIISGLPP